MITRIWHGWTLLEDADTYEDLLRTEILPGIAAKEIPGYRGVHLLRRDVAGEVEFITVMWFDSLDSVRSFMGDDYEVAYVPDSARKVLARFDERAQHYDMRLTPDETL
jgi:antibiotic biosynthesis monooxygenase (ABM) superfamily enzyme